jgi:polysaccharide biosynthesis transport protein
MDQQPPYNQPPPGNGGIVIVDHQGGYGRVPQEYQRPGNGYPYYPQFDATEAPGGFDFYKYLRILTKYRWLIVGIIGTALALALVVTFLMTPVYRATSSIEIDREAMNIVKVDGIQPDESRGGGLEFYQTQYELLASRSLVERVVTTLRLADDDQFLVQNRTIASTIRAWIFGEPQQVEASTPENKTRQLVSRLTGMLTISPVRGSRIVKINIDHPYPQVAQRVANGFAEVFIADNLDRRYDATSYARKFLEDRLQQLKGKLEESEKQAVKYAEEQGIINVDGNKNLSATDLEVVNAKLAEIRSERIKKELLWKQAQATDGLGLKEILESPAIQENRKLRAQIAAQYQQKLAIYKPAFPDMIELHNQIKELDRQVQTDVSSIKQSIQSAYIAAKEEEDSLLAQLDKSKSEVVDQRNRSIQYNILQREVDTNRQLYDGLLQRYKEIGVAGGVGTNNISIVDKAPMPILPRSPNIRLNIALGLLAGLLILTTASRLLKMLNVSLDYRCLVLCRSHLQVQPLKKSLAIHDREWLKPIEVCELACSFLQVRGCRARCL